MNWLRVEERFLTVELALLEEHGLTLPPETYPLKGLDPQRPGELAAQGAGGHAKGITQKGDVTPVAQGFDAGAVAVVATGRWLVNVVNDLPVGLAGAMRRVSGTGDNYSVVWLFQCFPP